MYSLHRTPHYDTMYLSERKGNNMNQYMVKVDAIKGQEPVYYGPYDFSKAFDVAEEKSEFFSTQIILLIP